MRAVTLEQVARYRAALLACHLWGAYGALSLSAAIDGLGAWAGIDPLDPRRHWLLLLEGVLFLGGGLTIYFALTPLTRAMMLSLLPSVGGESRVETAEGVLRLFGVLEGDPWWLRCLMTMPTVGVVCGVLVVALFFGEAQQQLLRFAVGTVVLSSVAWVPLSHWIWETS